MKAIFEFSLPEDNEEYKLYCNVHTYHDALYEMANDLRAKLKYDDIGEDPKKPTWEDVRSWFFRFADGIEL